jgi:plastocyanin
MTRDHTSTRSPRTRRATVVFAAGLVLIAGLLTSCSSSPTASTAPGSAGNPGGGTSGTSGTSSNPASTANTGDTIQVKNFAFSPSALSVAKGTTVTWKFDDSTAHTATADNGEFGSPKAGLANGKTYSFTFNTPGTYNYICTFHQYMKGSVTVK